MENEFVPYEIALALKQLGFDEPCIFSYTPHKFLYNNLSKIQVHGSDSIDLQRNTLFVSAPLYQQAFRWFREKHEVYGEIATMNNFAPIYRVYTKDGEVNTYKVFSTFDEAELECLKKLIEIVKNKK